jgi:hypothetical protein
MHVTAPVFDPIPKLQRGTQLLVLHGADDELIRADEARRAFKVADTRERQPRHDWLHAVARHDGRCRARGHGRALGVRGDETDLAGELAAVKRTLA